MGQFYSDDEKALRGMLREIGVNSVEDLFEDIPQEVRLRRKLDFPGPMAEWELMAHLRELSQKNISSLDAPHFIGAGCYDHHVFAAVKSLLKRGEFFTAYTPYQPELSQGTLQAMFEFQTFVVRLTEMEVANASMYDGATALAEAVLMAQRLRPERRKVILSKGVHFHWLQVVRTIVAPLELSLVEVETTESLETDWEAMGSCVDEDTICVVLQNPNFFGTIEDLREIQRLESQVHGAGALFVWAVVESTSLGLLKPPGQLGADIVVAEGQPLGLPMSFGGPHLGLFATREKYLRQMPGRLIGQTVDQEGKRGFVLTLATREQHIRRERATSNICTNQALCALAVTIHLALLGPTGLREIASRSARMAQKALEALREIPGVEIPQRRVYNEFVVRIPGDLEEINRALLRRNMVGGFNLGRLDPAWKGNWLLAFTEKNTEEQILELSQILRESLA